MTKFWLILISIYTLRDLMFQAIWLVHYLWLINNYYSRPIELIIHSNKKKKQNGWLKFHCNSVSESEILWIQEKAVTENKKKAMEFDLKVFKG